MIRGSYTSVSGIVAAQQRMDMLSNNVANANTTGFKEILSTQGAAGWDVGVTFNDGGGWSGLGPMSLGSVASGLTVNRTQGAMQQTDLPSDFAIQGDGLFVVGTPTGPAYTRAGNFIVDPNGTLVTQQGYPVLDTTGRAITVPGGVAGLAVGQDGTLTGTTQRMALVQFPAQGLSRLGENLYAIAGAVTPVAAGEGTIHQGALEASNVDMGHAMSDLIVIQRSFQMASRSLVLQDETLADANKLGSLRG